MEMNAQEFQELDSTKFFLNNFFPMLLCFILCFFKKLLPGSRNVDANAGVVQEGNRDLGEV